MSMLKYIIRSLWFYRKQHLALFAGVVISTAVLTGALVVGDSVNFSLRNLVVVRLGEISWALQSGDRFLTAGLADRLGKVLDTQTEGALLLEGFAVNPATNIRVSPVQARGVRSSFGTFFDYPMPELKDGEALISSNLADKLGVDTGESFLLRLPEQDVIPLNAPFAQDKQPSVGIRMRIVGILDDNTMGRFNLKSNQAAPFNVFVNIEFLAAELKLSGRVNTILFADADGDLPNEAGLSEVLKNCWQPEDLGVEIHELAEFEKIEVSSERVFIDAPISKLLQEELEGAEPVLTYLVNSIRTDSGSTPYSFVTAANPPYVPKSVNMGSLVINQWLADDIGAGVGDSVELSYFVVGPMRKLRELKKSFVVSTLIATGEYPADSSLMPDFPGLSGTSNCSDWDTGIPIDLKKIRDKDEKYWDDFRGTPKALISYQQGEALWSNEFGSVTALRFESNTVSREMVESTLLSGVHPTSLGLAFVPVFETGSGAAQNSVDFGELFLSLSFFVIAAGVLLLVLLFSLQTESRRQEVGVLTALGFTRRAILSFRMLELSFVALAGGIIGAAAGIGYNRIMIAALNTVWTDAVHTDVLQVSIEYTTLVVGAFSGIFIALLALWIVSLRKIKDPVAMLRESSGAPVPAGKAVRGKQQRIFHAGRFTALGALGLGILLSGWAGYTGIAQNSGLLLGAGAAIMVAAVAGISLRLDRMGASSGKLRGGIRNLALLNAGRNKYRSLTTIALFALGTFTIVITGANRKSFYGVESDRASGTGGFNYWIESAVPIPVDLSSPDGIEKSGLEDVLDSSQTIVQMLTLSGDDASCLNLNQVQQPRILGVDPGLFSEKGAFSFVKVLPGVDESDPWSELKKSYGPGVIPAFADQTVIVWGLMKKVGDTLNYLSEQGDTLKLVLAGGFANSVFQGNIVVDARWFRQYFPSVSGSQVMLVETDGSRPGELLQQLNAQLADYGLASLSTREKLALFNSVENTYLSVFMLLGGLGVLIGTLGLGIVMLRNIMERKRELALMAALGFQQKDITRLAFIENFFLLVSGLTIGLVGAFIGILPSLLSPEFIIPGTFVFWLVLAVFVSGLVWIWIPSVRILKLDLLPALRNE